MALALGDQGPQPGHSGLRPSIPRSSLPASRLPIDRRRKQDASCNRGRADSSFRGDQAEGLVEAHGLFLRIPITCF
jgi:hypothetical protein